MKFDWDATVDALRRSNNKIEREHFYFGEFVDMPGPCLIPPLQLNEGHFDFTGGTASGKTSLFLAPMITQAIRRKNRSVVVLDLKWDRGLFARTCSEARRAGLPLKYLAITRDAATYGFNPLKQRIRSKLAPMQMAELLMAGFGLQNGDIDPRTKYFETAGRRLLEAGLRMYPQIESLRELFDVVTAPDFQRRSGMLAHDYEYSGNAQNMLYEACSLEALNVTRAAGYSEQVVGAGIDVEDLLGSPCVLYFNLKSTVSQEMTHIVGRLFIRLFAAACRELEDPGQQVMVFVDEFQELVQQSMAGPLKQIRDAGVTMIMAHQSFSDLIHPGFNFLDTMHTNTNFRAHLTAKDDTIRKHLIGVSGERRDIIESISVSLQTNPLGETTYGVTESQSERMTTHFTQDDMNRLNAHAGLCIVESSPHSDFLRLNRPAFVFVPHMMSLEAYKEMVRTVRWPAIDACTLIDSQPPPRPVPVVSPPAVAQPTPPPTLPPKQKKKKQKPTPTATQLEFGDKLRGLANPEE